MDIMSEDTNNTSFTCASCGIAEIDDIKLKDCSACDLVRYCSDDCKLIHKSQHSKACRERAAELRDELLFKEPESTHLGDCPICFLPLPLDLKKCSLLTCCSKIICIGCVIANKILTSFKTLYCPFCREASPKTEEEWHKLRMKRVEANDPVAMCQEGLEQYEIKNYIKAVEYLTRAAALGNADAQYRLSDMYRVGQGVEKDRVKKMYYLEEAAIGGHPEARHNLGCEEWSNGNAERAVKHWIIAATQGEEESTKKLMGMFKGGFVSKEVLAATLRAHQAAVDATKSPQREFADEYGRFTKERGYD